MGIFKFIKVLQNQDNVLSEKSWKISRLRTFLVDKVMHYRNFGLMYMTLREIIANLAVFLLCYQNLLWRLMKNMKPNTSMTSPMKQRAPNQTLHTQ